MYRVIVAFTDLQNGNVYQIGDEFPRSGVVVTDARLSELASNSNKRRMPLIVLENADKGNAQEKTENSSEVQKTVKNEYSEPKEEKTAEVKPKRQYKKRVNADA